MLTRSQMEAILRGGSSVLYRNQVISSAAGLPSEAEIAAADPKAAGDIDARIAHMEGQLAALKSVRPQVMAATAKESAAPASGTPPADEEREPFEPAPMEAVEPDEDKAGIFGGKKSGRK